MGCISLNIILIVFLRGISWGKTTNYAREESNIWRKENGNFGEA